jgi:LPXTG-motif cell wall-anchored protein
VKHRVIGAVVALLAASTAGIVLAPRAQAATFTVTSGNETGPGTLHQAILDANANPGADVITVDPSVPLIDGSNLPFITESLAIQGNGAGVTVIDTGIGTGFDVLVDGVGSFTFADFTTNGNESIFVDVGAGDTATITIEDVEVENFGTIDIESSGTATVNLTRVDVVDNSAIDLGTSGSGVMTAVITDSRIESSFRDGITVTGAGATLTVERSLIANIADDGIIALEGATLTIRNTTITGIGDGQDGIRIGGPSTLVNVTIADVESGGFGITVSGSSAVPLTLTNTIIQGTEDEACGPLLVITSGGGNIVDDDTCVLSQPTDLETTDALLGALADNGGRTRTLLPLTGSPAIDGGVATGCPVDDQRGLSRPADGNGDSTAVCDAGAVEVAAVAVTTTTTTTTTTTIAPTTTAAATTAPTTAPATTVAPTTSAALLLPATGTESSTNIGLIAAALLGLGSLLVLVIARRRPTA